MVLTASISESIVHRLADGEEVVRIGASFDEYLETINEFEGSIYVINYEDDEIVATMGQATDIHELICGNIIGIFYTYFRKHDYRTYGSNSVVYSHECNRTFNPDVLVIKGKAELLGIEHAVKPILNPHILVEVVSGSNYVNWFVKLSPPLPPTPSPFWRGGAVEKAPLLKGWGFRGRSNNEYNLANQFNYGQGFRDKIWCCQQVPTVQQIVLVEQSKPFVEVLYRTEKPNEWLNKTYAGLDKTLEIDGFEISLTEIYQNVI